MDDMWNAIPPNMAQNKNASAQSASPFNVLKEVQGDSRPSQIDFAAWFGRMQHPRDYDDQFYAENFKILYDRTTEFSQKWFGAGVHFGQYVGPNGSGWSAPLTEQFLQYSRLVAHEDRPRKTWSNIINEPDQRKWLAVGILSQVLEKKIFNELLFGANKFFQDELERHDMLWIRREGYTRKEGRANIAKSALDGGLVPDNFWNSIDDLTGKTVLIFRPLLDLMRALRPSEKWRSQAVFWQELHILLAFAGYLQVCTAISPSVFHFLSATPGARMDYSLEQQADMPQYRDSKFWHEREEKKYQKGLDALAKGHNANLTELQQLSGLNELPSTKEERNTDRHHRTRGAKIKFAVFPKVTRYRPENIGVDLPVDQPSSPGEYEEAEGQRISDITRCIVVYYQGLIYPRPNQTDGVPLETHLNEVTPRHVFFSLPSLVGLQRGWDWQGSWGWKWESSPRVPRALDVNSRDSALRNIFIAFFFVTFIGLFLNPDFSHDINKAVGNSSIGSVTTNFYNSIQHVISPTPRSPGVEDSYYSEPW
ncbi:hypothetical protein F5X99DRAFT_400612 [Biscogniauxia marginata]|nr:hypothetical protein F5X99DRAFT_400612 [Biscogniauxia marginata]